MRSRSLLQPCPAARAPAHATPLSGSMASIQPAEKPIGLHKIVSSLSVLRGTKWNLHYTKTLPIHAYVPHNELATNKQRYYCRRSEKDTKRDLHFHITTAE